MMRFSCLNVISTHNHNYFLLYHRDRWRWRFFHLRRQWRCWKSVEAFFSRLLVFILLSLYSLVGLLFSAFSRVFKKIKLLFHGEHTKYNVSAEGDNNEYFWHLLKIVLLAVYACGFLWVGLNMKLLLGRWGVYCGFSRVGNWDVFGTQWNYGAIEML